MVDYIVAAQPKNLLQLLNEIDQLRQQIGSLSLDAARWNMSVSLARKKNGKEVADELIAVMDAALARVRV